MKRITYFFATVLLLLCTAGCAKRNFFPDTDDPGLSRFTSNGYNIATVYINGDAFINPFLGAYRGNSLPSLSRITTSGTVDSLTLSWSIVLNNDAALPFNGVYQNISLMIPVDKSFTQNDFLSWNGKRLAANSNSIYLNSFNSSATGILAGLSNIYFVQINIDNSKTSSKVYQISGLFDGNIGDSILITKGRFDFSIPASSLNF